MIRARFLLVARGGRIELVAALHYTVLFHLKLRIIPPTVWENGRKAVKVNLSFEGYL